MTCRADVSDSTALSTAVQQTSPLMVVQAGSLDPPPEHKARVYILIYIHVYIFQKGQSHITISSKRPITDHHFPQASNHCSPFSPTTNHHCSQQSPIIRVMKERDNIMANVITWSYKTAKLPAAPPPWIPETSFVRAHTHTQISLCTSFLIKHK